MSPIDRIILQHREDDVERLALQLQNFSTEEKRYILQQIEGWQRLRYKVPSWAATEGLHYPVRLSLEQCSSQTTAQYKADILNPKSKTPHPESRPSLLVDLTGGLGVDFSFMARGYRRAVYVEQNPDLCALARHNFPLLGLSGAEVVEGDGVAFLEQMQERADVIFLDPFRRDDQGHKTVRIEDCTPNILPLLPLLAEKADRVLVKLSPMLDITQALRSLAATPQGCRPEVHIVGTQGEVKEVLLEVNVRQQTTDHRQPKVHCHDDQHHFSFHLQDEAAAVASPPCHRTMLEGAYLYEPAPVVMKAGCFRLLAERYGLVALHPNSHLYVGSTLISDFPGRRFQILRLTGFGKKELRDFLRAAPTQKNGRGPCANLAVRNFPMTVAQLRQRLGLHDGGSEYWFATTLADNDKILIATIKAQCLPQFANGCDRKD